MLCQGLQMSLDSLKEEKRLLQDKLQSEQEAHRRASQELEAEIEKVTFVSYCCMVCKLTL